MAYPMQPGIAAVTPEVGGMSIFWKARFRRAFVALALATGAPALAAEPSPSSDGSLRLGRPEESRPKFATKGAIELGGSLSIESSGRLFELASSPTAGYFLRDRIELSVQLRMIYQSKKEDDDSRTNSGSGTLVFEPSYHLPFQKNLFIFAGLGLGVGHDSDDFLIELTPRFGVKFLVGENGLLTPALRVPILIAAPDTGVGIGIDAGYSVAW